MPLTVGGRIKIARGHIHQKELANLINVSVGTLSRWENNEFAPSFADVVKIAKVTQRPIEFFAGVDVSDDETEKRKYMGDLMQWAAKTNLHKLKALIEILNN
jgi:transcriptional regulator with XRE-family HTH domain